MIALKKSLRIASALALLVSIGVGAPAYAETKYQYWSFWQASSEQSSTPEWSLASVGAGSIPAAQGLVQGWRFITAGVEVGQELAPRIAPDFAAICGSTPAADGKVQVALVIDYGLESDLGIAPPTPRSVCVEVSEGEPSTMAIAMVAEVRDEAGFVCSLDQVPATGCGEEVAVLASAPNADQAAASAPQTNADEMWDLVANIVTTVLGLVVFVMAWRRMMQQKAEKRRRQTGTDDSEPASPSGND
jgi:hypothetical protein